MFVLDVARYAFELTNNHLLNNLTKSVQDLMTDLGLISVNALSNVDTFSDNTIFPYDTPNGVAAKASLQQLYGQTKRQDFQNGKS